MAESPLVAELAADMSKNMAAAAIGQGGSPDVFGPALAKAQAAQQAALLPVVSVAEVDTTAAEVQADDAEAGQ